MFVRVTTIRWPANVEQESMALNSGLSGLRTGTQQGTLHNVRATRIKNTGQECLLKVKAHGEQLYDSKQGGDGGSPIGFQCPSFLLRLHLLPLSSTTIYSPPLSIFSFIFLFLPLKFWLVQKLKDTHLLPSFIFDCFPIFYYSFFIPDINIFSKCTRNFRKEFYFFLLAKHSYQSQIVLIGAD